MKRRKKIIKAVLAIFAAIMIFSMLFSFIGMAFMN